MAADWRRFCNGKEFAIDGETILVTLPGGRVHRVSVIDQPDAILLTSIVVRASKVVAIEHLPLEAWQRNRGTELVGFKVDGKWRLIGEAWAPKAGLTAAEFGAYVHAIAAECDRFEYQLTGADDR